MVRKIAVKCFVFSLKTVTLKVILEVMSVRTCKPFHVLIYSLFSHSPDHHTRKARIGTASVSVAFALKVACLAWTCGFCGVELWDYSGSLFFPAIPEAFSV